MQRGGSLQAAGEIGSADLCQLNHSFPDLEFVWVDRWVLV